VVVADLTGCLASYPTASDVYNARNNLPRLETITDGRAYLAAARDELVAERSHLQLIDYGLDAGIVGGVVTTALGTALKWSSHGTITAGILSAATIGVSSTLNLKQQQLIINRGLDALICVESQAEAAYAPVRQRDAVLAPVAADIDALAEELSRPEVQVESSSPLANVVSAARADLLNAQNWLSVQTVPIANAVVSAKIGVDTVLQTTVDQLNAALPDGSAFSKISLSPPSVAKSPSPTPPPTNQTSKAVNAYRISSGRLQPQVTPLGQPDEATRLLTLTRTLDDDMVKANDILTQMGPSLPVAQLPTINCPVATSLQISPTSITISHSKGGTAPAAISGGTPKYKATITANSSSLTPENIQVSGLGPESVQAGATRTPIVLTNLKDVKVGPYNLVITDAIGGHSIASITEN
jgi:hypothetical protein